MCIANFTLENSGRAGYKVSMEMDIAKTVQNVVTFMPAFLAALVIHEFAHAWMASRFGDKTSAWAGRLTLNPAVHMDPFGTVAFPLLSILMGSSIFFGWAKPVPIDTRQFSNYSKGLFWVSFAGPLSNLLLGFFTAFALMALRIFVPESAGFYKFGSMFFESLLVLNFSLAIFNLIPIPPLDGSNMVLSFLGYEASQKFMALQQYSFFLLLFLMFSGALKVITIPIIFLANASMGIAAGTFGMLLGG